MVKNVFFENYITKIHTLRLLVIYNGFMIRISKIHILRLLVIYNGFMIRIWEWSISNFLFFIFWYTHLPMGYHTHWQMHIIIITNNQSLQILLFLIILI